MTGESTQPEQTAWGEGCLEKLHLLREHRKAESSVTDMSPKGQLKGDLCGRSYMNLHM